MEHENSTPEAQANRPAGKPEHETHWSALIFLILTVLVVVIVALSAANPPANQADNNRPDTATATENISTSGATIPVEDVATATNNNLAGLPAGIPVNVDTIEKNFTQNENTRIVTYRSPQSLQVVSAEYQAWLEENNVVNFEIDRRESSLSIRSGNLIVLISADEQSGQTVVQINYTQR